MPSHASLDLSHQPHSTVRNQTILMTIATKSQQNNLEGLFFFFNLSHLFAILFPFFPAKNKWNLVTYKWTPNKNREPNTKRLSRGPQHQHPWPPSPRATGPQQSTYASRALEADVSYLKLWCYPLHTQQNPTCTIQRTSQAGPQQWMM